MRRLRGNNAGLILSLSLIASVVAVNAAISNHQFVESDYISLFARDADAGGYLFWNTTVDNPGPNQTDARPTLEHLSRKY